MSRDELTSWKKNIRNYEKSKQRLPWKEPPRVNIVREIDIRSKDYEYNPILQKYNDPVKEKAMEQKEKVSRACSLSSKYSKAIQYNRDYDIINFKQKTKVKDLDQDAKEQKSIEAQLPINNIKRQAANQAHETTKYSKRPSASYSKRFNPLKVVNTDIRFIDNVILSYNIGDACI